MAFKCHKCNSFQSSCQAEGDALLEAQHKAEYELRSFGCL